ncbi:hypothetical protein BDB01DRAFT_893945 [Pilobolus umbonatus]|nr:hypothetical protein BDB01DRAFT_893945 [Pilobolus umbonatus]
MQQEKTLVLVPLSLKDELFSLIQQSELNIIADSVITTNALSDIINKEIVEEQLVHGVIIEGADAIQVGLDLVSCDGSLLQSKEIPNMLIHASLPADADRETDWFQSLVMNDLVAEKVGKSDDNSSTSSSPARTAMKKSKKSSVGKSLVSSTTKKSTRNTAGTQVNSTLDPTKKVTVSTPRSGQSKIPNVKSKTPTSTIPTTTKKTTTARTSNLRRSSTVTNIPGTKLKNPNTVTPPVRKADGNTGTVTGGRRASIMNNHAGIPKKLTSTAKGGVTKNTPPVSAITGRTRKYSRLTEKRPTKTEDSQQSEKSGLKLKRSSDTIKVKEEEVEKTVVEEVEETVIEDAPVIVEEAEEITNKLEMEQEVERDAVSPVIDTETPAEEETAEEETVEETPIETPVEKAEVITQEPEVMQDEIITQPVSHHSTCSSTATDEHDAEVAATTASVIKERSSSFIERLSPSGRKSFSPNSVASLPRPETPEVDQLRLRFENIIQTPDSKAPIQRSSKIPPEFYTRIKDMKPRGPVGSRVKSMVELFMDENLNKWEF